MKKNFLVVALCVFSVFSLCGCNDSVSLPAKESEPVENIIAEMSDEKPVPISLVTGCGYKYKSDSKTYKTLISATYPHIEVFHGDEKKYPELAVAFDELNGEKMNKQLELFNENTEYAKESYDTLGKSFVPFEFTEDVRVRRGDTNVVSLLFDGANYSGGAHATYYMWGENYDTETGKLLSLSDVVTDTEKIQDAIFEQAEKLYPGKITVSDVEAAFEHEEYVSWTVDYNAVTFYLTPAGSVSYVVTLPFDEYSSLINDKYKNVPDAFGVQLTNNTPFYYDVTGDGKIDKIQFSAVKNEYDEYDEYAVMLNDNTFKKKCYGFEMDVTFIKAKNDKYLLSVGVTMENDYRSTFFYSLGDIIKETDEIDSAMRSNFLSDPEALVLDDVLTNPDHFCMDTISQFLCTTSARRDYFINDSGRLEAKTKNYIFDTENMLELTMLREMETDIYNEATDRTEGNRILEKGEKVLYYSTDNEKYIYLQCEDGTICRKEVEYGDYPTTIKGIDVNDLFDGLFFAG